MRTLKRMPKEGQFIAVWKFNDFCWSATLQWINGNLHHYVENFEEDNNSEDNNSDVFHEKWTDYHLFDEHTRYVVLD